MATLLWMQGICCGGETVSLLNAEQPSLLTLLKTLGYDYIWHPLFSVPTGTQMEEIAERITRGQARLGVLVIEGALYTALTDARWPLKAEYQQLTERVSKMATAADYVIAVGTCASFGGIIAVRPNTFGAVGVQFYKEKPGGFLPADFRSRAGAPVINIPGCPAHPDWMTTTLDAISRGNIGNWDLDKYNRPRLFYSKLAHHACPRNEYYEFKASAVEYSQQGCLFENLGCKGTLCESDCNERLWLSRTGSCPRGGFPCLSCTSPLFPDGFTPFFETAKIGNIPTTLPRDVPKAWYVGISGLAKLACPERLKRNAVSRQYIPEEGGA